MSKLPAVAAEACNPRLTLTSCSWTSAQAFPTKSGPSLLKVKNPDGSTDGLIFDVHSKCHF